MTKRKSRSKKKRPFLPCICEALAMFETLRRLGFSADQIFCAYYEDQVAVVLRAQEKEFVITCGNTDLSQDDFYDAWKHACAMWNDTEPGLSTKDREEIYGGSEIRKQGSMAMVAAIQAKGIDVPMMQKLEELAGRPQASAPASFVNSKGGEA